MHVQIDFLINHLERDWRALAEWIQQLGGYELFYFFCEQLCEHVAQIFEEAIEEEVNPDQVEDGDPREIEEMNGVEIIAISSYK